MLKWYLDCAYTVLIRPILFYTKLPPGEWTDQPVTFTVISSWVLAALISLFVFINQLIPIGMTLFEKVSGPKIIYTFPVTVVLAFMFFVVVLSIVGGGLMALFLAVFYALGALLYWSSRWLGGKGSYLDSIKSGLYMSGVLLVGFFLILLAFSTKMRILDFTNFTIGYNIIYSLSVLYLYGLMAIAARKIHNLDRSKAFLAALLPVLFLIIFGFFVDKAILPKLKNWVG